VVVIYPEEICYLQVTPEDVPEIVEQTIGKKGRRAAALCRPGTDEKAAHESDIPFYKNQERTSSAATSKSIPSRIDDYLAIGGYSALAKVLTA
jgi:NADP-reducing hydrogenase subunit HndC